MSSKLRDLAVRSGITVYRLEPEEWKEVIEEFRSIYGDSVETGQYAWYSADCPQVRIVGYSSIEHALKGWLESVYDLDV